VGTAAEFGVNAMATPITIDAPNHLHALTADRAGSTIGGIERLLGIGVTIDVAGGQTIVVEGDPLRHCYRVIKGAVRLYKSIRDGRRQVIDFMADGDAFGLLDSMSYSCSVEAITATTLVRHPRCQLEKAVAADPAAAAGLMALACSELERTQRQMLLLGRKTAEEKIASFLLAYCVRKGTKAGEHPAIRFAMSRQDIADYLGLTIETVSRTFSRLKQRGLILLPTPQEVVVLRPDVLEGLAEGR
jgi:CRP/FNR family transcriptional regulator